MNIFRSVIDNGYFLIKEIIYTLTENNPEIAHDKFIELSKKLNLVGLDKLLLDTYLNRIKLPFELSNAAGFNKNGDIPPKFLEYLGFNRIVVGTVTNDEWVGNPIPRMIRYPRTKSLVNWMGLPGIGSKRIAENLESFGEISLPITINLMSTPQKEGDDLLKDLEGTIKDTIKFADRFELNISCPNTDSTKANQIDSRDEYQKQLSSMLQVLTANSQDKELYLKVSPDLEEDGVKEILNVVSDYKIDGITCTNTTTNHFKLHIPKSPNKGGASGRAVQHNSKKVHKYFIDKINSKNLDLKIIACGGIDNILKLKERFSIGTEGIQIYTPLIFEGPKLLSEIRKVYEYF